MKLFVDMHTHILPKIDDGAKSVEESLIMLDRLEKDGVSAVFLTPHFYFRGEDVETFLHRRQKSYEALLQAYKGNIRFYLGAEVEFSNISIDYGIFQDLSIEKGKYILLELPFIKDCERIIFQKIEKFIYTTGLIPIIAHIERYTFTQKNPSAIAELIKMGCLIQVNANSIIQSKKRSLVYAICEHEQMHLIGTDCHDNRERSPCYKQAIDILQLRYGEKFVATLKQISTDIIDEKKMTPTTDNGIRKVFGVYK